MLVGRRQHRKIETDRDGERLDHDAGEDHEYRPSPCQRDPPISPRREQSVQNRQHEEEQPRQNDEEIAWPPRPLAMPEAKAGIEEDVDDAGAEDRDTGGWEAAKKYRQADNGEEN